MSKSTWSDVEKGDLVELRGNPWTVAKIKKKGKRAAVKVTDGPRTFDSEVKLADRVKLLGRPAVQDASGQQTRWAKKRELDAVLAEPGRLPAGDAKKTKPPSKPTGGVWDRPIDRVEATLADLMSARLVAETPDEKAGYYVPPVDVSTIAAHLSLFHGIDVAGDHYPDEGAMLADHKAMHEKAERGELYLFTNHWHTAKRPGS